LSARGRAVLEAHAENGAPIAPGVAVQ